VNDKLKINIQKKAPAKMQGAFFMGNLRGDDNEMMIFRGYIIP
jgi:hypothetical protein